MRTKLGYEEFVRVGHRRGSASRTTRASTRSTAGSTRPSRATSRARTPIEATDELAKTGEDRAPPGQGRGHALSSGRGPGDEPRRPGPQEDGPAREGLVSKDARPDRLIFGGRPSILFPQGGRAHGAMERGGNSWRGPRRRPRARRRLGTAVRAGRGRPRSAEAAFGDEPGARWSPLDGTLALPDGPGRTRRSGRLARRRPGRCEWLGRRGRPVHVAGRRENDCRLSGRGLVSARNSPRPTPGEGS
ncbi:MAG: hypothetical protein M0C28_07175 [Candidatus Moduliflexus flocculans]|nr:hypothetical protein [Candidatus Moduliflexus flocculans]